KVDAGIPWPAAGTLTEVLVQEGQTVAVNSIVARIGAEGEAPGAPATPPPSHAAPKEPEQVAANQSASLEMEQDSTGVSAASASPVSSNADTLEKPKPEESATAAPAEDENVTSLDERRRTKSSPLVRKIALENNIDIQKIEGSGVSGRVTKNDILDFLQQPQDQKQPAAKQPAAAPAAKQPAAAKPAAAPQFAPGETSRIETLTVMRKRIAQHMVHSKQTSAHVTTVFEYDFTAIERLRKQHKESYAERGAKITYLPFIIQAVIAGLREFPILNASMDDTSVTYHKALNIGIAVALEWGLIVPVLKNADEKNILGISRAVSDLGDRARSKKLSPDDVQGGTFTITNPGIYGGLFGTPIINQPQVAILGVGGVKKRPVVIETDDGDFIAIRSMCIMSLSFDHRLIDGAVADQFMARLKEIIEAGDFTM
ncbi:MAG: 2-oxo acid dehydrogenase subunit E2, partial [Thermoanaerobaculia bacterium]|nr:2-oxo acid dehydrogenase subunit E2 [Thermoanaerobaculia bacterium]